MLVSARKFLMGPYAGPPVASEAIQVTLSRGFWMGKYLVTQSLYEFVMGENPSGFRGASLPVESVFKRQADEFCAKLTRIERVAKRLPEGWEVSPPHGGTVGICVSCRDNNGIFVGR